MNRLKENKLFKIVSTIIRGGVIVILVGFILAVCLQRFSDNKISIFKYRMFTVISGSMRPKHDIGDVLISKEVKPSTIKVGDTISYKGKVGDLKNKVITHEVTKVIKDEETGKYNFHARGLTNVIEDPIISEDQIYGVVIYKSLILSLIYRIIGTNIGFYFFIIIPLLYIIGSEIITMLLSREENRRRNL
mgnify:CR=1 FL=1